MPDRRHLARPVHRRPGAGGQRSRRRSDADADRHRNGSRSCRSRKAAAPTTAFSCSCSSWRPPRWPPSRSIGWRPTSCEGRRHGIAAFPTPTRRPSTPPTVSPSRSGVCSAAFAFRARARVDMPAPGDMRPARLKVAMLRPRSGKPSTCPSSASSARSLVRLNRLQFLTIRQYLSVVFGALVALLLVLAAWP